MRTIFLCSLLIATSLTFVTCDDDATEPLDPLSAPTNITMEYADLDGDFSRLGLTMRWDAVEGAVSYRVRLYFDDAYSISNDLDLPPDANEVDLDVSTPEAVYEALLPGERFAYRVAAVRSDGAMFTEEGIRLTTAPIVPDPVLSDCINDALGALELTWDGPEPPTYADITLLSCSTNDSIYSLDGIEVVSGVERLYLGFNEIEDITPLTALAYLDDLILSNNPVADISPLSNIPTITRLGLVEIESINSLSVLADLPILSELIIGDNPLLQNLDEIPTTVTMLHLHGDITTVGLLNHTQLEELSLMVSEATMTTLEPADFSVFTSLTFIFLQDFPLTDTSFTAPMSNLTDISLFNNGLTDITSLLTLPSLESAALVGNDNIPCTQLNDLATHLGAENLIAPENCAQ